MKYKGSCHCQKIRIEVETDLNEGMECNCSICSRRGHILHFVGPQQFKLLSSESSLTDYQWGKKSIHFYFCSTCGTAPFGRGQSPEGEMIAVNVRCLEDIDLSKLKIQHFDGKNLI